MRGFEVPAEHELLAPTLLRSQILSALHRGKIAPEVVLDQLTRIRALPIRLLGDAVELPNSSDRSDRGRPPDLRTTTALAINDVGRRIRSSWPRPGVTRIS